MGSMQAPRAATAGLLQPACIRMAQDFKRSGLGEGSDPSLLPFHESGDIEARADPVSRPQKQESPARGRALQAGMGSDPWNGSCPRARSEQEGLTPCLLTSSRRSRARRRRSCSGCRS
jgi:hypothetical protein